MYWAKNLIKLYDNNEHLVGKYEVMQKGRGDKKFEKKVALIPISHEEKKADITITLSENGKFMGACVNTLEDSQTICPSTIDSSCGRTTKLAPYPLFDKLQYVAKDYKEYGKRKCGYDDYEEQLSKWVDSDFTNKSIKSILIYVRKGTLIQDLVSEGIFFVDDEGKIIKYHKKDKKIKSDLDDCKLFKKKDKKDGALDSFVRFAVEIKDKNSHIWATKELWDSWIKYYNSIQEKKCISYISGEEDFFTDKHPKNIFPQYANGKIFCKNGSVNLKGNILEDETQICNIGYKDSQKMHNALKWVISIQEYQNMFEGFVIFSPFKPDKIPTPDKDMASFLFGTQEEIEDTKSYTGDFIAKKIKSKLQGYFSGDIKISENEITIICFDFLSTGRDSMTYNRTFSQEEYIQNLQDWYDKCKWNFLYVKENILKKYIGTPTPMEIIRCMYGDTKIRDSLRNKLLKKIVFCIIEKKKIPEYIIEACIKKCFRFKKINSIEFAKKLNIICALNRYNQIKKGKGEFKMHLDREETNRSYLFGRLLYLADYAQISFKGKEKVSSTMASLNMRSFKSQPLKTWYKMYPKLLFYINKIKKENYGLAVNLEKEIDSIMCNFKEGEFNNDKLDGNVCYGMSNQRAYFYSSKEEKKLIEKELTE